MSVKNEDTAAKMVVRKNEKFSCSRSDRRRGS
jgi:hypothetical protein